MNLEKLKSGKDYYLTFLTEFIVLLSGVFVYKLAAVNFGNVGFAEYALCRRTVSFFQPVMLLGFAVGIPRYLAMFNEGNEKKKGDQYFIAGAFIAFAFTLIVLLIMNAFGKPFAWLLFGSNSMQKYILPVSLFISALVIHSVCYSFFRGKLMMRSANLLQLINLGIIPLVILAFNDTYRAVLITGILGNVVSLFFLVIIYTKLNRSFTHVKTYGKELFIYGIQRIPGDIALAGFFAFPAFIAAHHSGIEVAGYVAFSISLLSMVGGVFGPFSLVMLPKSVQLIKENNLPLLKKNTTGILKITLISTLTGLVVFEVFANQIIYLYLGENFDELIASARIVMLACLGYTLYISLRSVLDAFHFKAVNTKNIIIAFLFFLLLVFISMFISSNPQLFLYAFSLAISLLGLLTYIEFRKIFLTGVVARQL